MKNIHISYIDPLLFLTLKIHSFTKICFSFTTSFNNVLALSDIPIVVTETGLSDDPK